MRNIVRRIWWWATGRRAKWRREFAQMSLPELQREVNKYRSRLLHIMETKKT